jgi:hypothetical protein
MIKKHKIPNKLVSDFELRISDFHSIAMIERNFA